MFLTGVWALVIALITSWITSLGLFCGVQPSRRLSSGPTVAPFGPQAWSFTTPVLVLASNAPWVTEAWCESMIASGSVTRTPPSQVIAPAVPSALHPTGLLTMIGIDVKKRLVLGSQAGCSSDRPMPAGMIDASTEILARILV